MPTPIIFTITTAGRVAALDAFDNGLTIALTQCAIGSGQYIPDGTETVLDTELGRYNLSGGSIESGSATLRFSTELSSVTHLDVFEIGLFSSTGVLFAVASTTGSTPLTVVEPNIDTICSFGMVLGDVPASSLTITLDPNAPLAIALMDDHIGESHPHQQYKRTDDDSERLKIAKSTENNEALRRDQMLSPIDSDIKLAILRMMYPPGTPYFNRSDGRNPNEIYGVNIGTWAREEAHMLAGFKAGDPKFGTAGGTGGAREHAMTLENMIQHDHFRNVDNIDEYVNVGEDGQPYAGNYSPGANYIKKYSKTASSGMETPTPIPTLSPYVTYHWWVRIA